jgi:hypothetical protein
MLMAHCVMQALRMCQCRITWPRTCKKIVLNGLIDGGVFLLCSV